MTASLLGKCCSLLLLQKNAAQRLRWRKEHRNWTLEQWRRLLRSDESRFTLFRSDGRVWIWRLPGECLLSECTVPTVKRGGGGVMLWGSFSWYGMGPLVLVHGNMNSEVYRDILDNCVLPTLWQFYVHDECFFQDDNATCHVSRATLAWYTENLVNRMDWPARSSDLNPMENLWDKLE